MSSTVTSYIKKGSILGGVLLIAGSCIGAGMLALPVITGIGGFIPSLVWFCLAWAFMTTTGLLLLEVNLALGHNLSLISLAEKTLGKSGKIACWILFIFLFYSLNIAYISASGGILSGIAADFFGINLPLWSGSLLFTAIFSLVIFLGTRGVDYFNRLLMFGLALSYVLLVILGSFHIHPSYLQAQFWKMSLASIPVLIISFGFHNMIPSLAMYFHGDKKRLRITILVGSLIPLIIYVIWEAIMLGIIPIQGREGLLTALDKGEAATEALRQAIGKSRVTILTQAFALFAIITSFLAQSLSLVDFLADGLKVSKIKWGRVFLITLALFPPFVFALLYPGIFIKALNFAGGFCAVILFGMMPALMVWVVKYQRSTPMTTLVPSRRGVCVLILLIAGAIFLLQAAQELGVIR